MEQGWLRMEKIDTDCKQRILKSLAKLFKPFNRDWAPLTQSRRAIKCSWHWTCFRGMIHWEGPGCLSHSRSFWKETQWHLIVVLGLVSHRGEKYFKPRPESRILVPLRGSFNKFPTGPPPFSHASPRKSYYRCAFVFDRLVRYWPVSF